MKLCMMLPAAPDRRWRLARQMGVDRAITKLAPDLTGTLPPWDLDTLLHHQARFRDEGIEVVGLEGDQFDMSRIKQGLDGRDEDIERYKRMLGAMGRAGIPLLCLNFMVGIGWYRTATAIPARGGALVSAFDMEAAEALGATPAGVIPQERVWDNYAYFIRRVAPAAEAAGVRLGLHPDDPPVPSLRGVGRVLTSADAMQQALDIAGSPAVGLTFCQGSFRSMNKDVVRAVHRFGPRIAFVHVRDVRRTPGGFVETFPDEGDTDMAAVFRAYRDVGFAGPVRPDHAPAMEGDAAHAGEVSGTNVGYEATGMVFTVGYMRGLLDATNAQSRQEAP